MFNIKKIKDKDLKGFYLNMGRLLKAGISLKKAIEFQEKNCRLEELKKRVISTSRRLKRGEELYSILSSEKLIEEQEALIIYVFENSGNIGEGFLKLAELKERKERLNSEIKVAISYPLFILIVSFIVLVLIFYLIVPNFKEMYSETQAIPLLTRVILKISDIMVDYPYLLVLEIGLIVLIIRYMIQKNRFQNLPLLKRYFEQRYLISILENISTLLNSGISLDKTIDIVLGTIDNKRLKSKLYILKNIKRGESLSNCFSKVNLLKKEEIDMIRVGEESGNIALIIGELAKLRETELEKRVKISLKLLEPILLLIIGVTISLFVIGLYIPILNIGDSLNI